MINFRCHVEEETFAAYMDKLQLFADINDRAESEKENQILSKTVEGKGAGVLRREKRLKV
jgi:hypothetical protein